MSELRERIYTQSFARRNPARANLCAGTAQWPELNHCILTHSGVGYPPVGI